MNELITRQDKESTIRYCRRLGGSASGKIRKVQSDIAGLQNDSDSMEVQGFIGTRKMLEKMWS